MAAAAAAAVVIVLIMAPFTATIVASIEVLVVLQVSIQAGTASPPTKLNRQQEELRQAVGQHHGPQEKDKAL